MSTELIELPFISRTYCDGCDYTSKLSDDKDGGYGTPMKYYDRKTQEFVCSIYPDHRETVDDFFRFSNGIRDTDPMGLQAIIMELVDDSD